MVSDVPAWASVFLSKHVESSRDYLCYIGQLPAGAVINLCKELIRDVDVSHLSDVVYACGGNL